MAKVLVVPSERMNDVTIPVKRSPRWHRLIYAYSTPSFDALIDHPHEFEVGLMREDFTTIFYPAKLKLVLTTLTRIDDTEVLIKGHFLADCLESRSLIRFPHRATVRGMLKLERSEGYLHIERSRYIKWIEELEKDN